MQGYRGAGVQGCGVDGRAHLEQLGEVRALAQQSRAHNAKNKECARAAAGATMRPNTRVLAEGMTARKRPETHMRKMRKPLQGPYVRATDETAKRGGPRFCEIFPEFAEAEADAPAPDGEELKAQEVPAKPGRAATSSELTNFPRF